MTELYYVPSLKVSAKVADLVQEGYHIEIEGITYQRLSKKPRGRSIQRTFITTDETIKKIIYN